MEAKELRIGNIVYNSYSGKKEPILAIISKVADLHFGGNQYSGYMFPSSKNIIDFDNVEPIPITREWLERFGFIEVYDPNDTVYERDAFYVSRPKDRGFEVCISMPKARGDIFGINGINLQYAHQLQNLYFALTGEELTLKEVVG